MFSLRFPKSIGRPISFWSDRHRFLEFLVLTTKLNILQCKSSLWRSGSVSEKNGSISASGTSSDMRIDDMLRQPLIRRAYCRSCPHLVELGRIPLIWSNISAADPAFRPQLYWHFGLESSQKSEFWVSLRRVCIETGRVTRRQS